MEDVKKVNMSLSKVMWGILICFLCLVIDTKLNPLHHHGFV